MRQTRFIFLSGKWLKILYYYNRSIVHTSFMHTNIHLIPRSFVGSHCSLPSSLLLVVQMAFGRCSKSALKIFKNSALASSSADSLLASIFFSAIGFSSGIHSRYFADFVYPRQVPIVACHNVCIVGTEGERADLECSENPDTIAYYSSIHPYIR